jgi:hypothetical protein
MAYLQLLCFHQPQRADQMICVWRSPPDGIPVNKRIPDREARASRPALHWRTLRRSLDRRIRMTGST